MSVSDRPRVGLVLGAGGVLGGAWLVGALHAIATETGWDPGSAERLVGTSAGAMVGALVVSGLPPWFMVAHSAEEDFDGLPGAAGARRAPGWDAGLEVARRRAQGASGATLARSCTVSCLDAVAGR